jgi:MFS family permease
MLSFDPFCGNKSIGGGVFWLFIIGRFFNGVGVGAFRVAGNILIKNWFPDKELSMVMTGFVRQGDTAGVVIDANAVGKIGTNGMRFLFGTIFITFSFVAVFVLYLRPSAVESKNDVNTSLWGAINKQLKRIVQDSKEFPRVYWILVSVLVCYDGVTTPFMSMAGSMVADSMKEHYKENDYSKGTSDVLTANIRSLTKYVCILGPFIGLMVDRFGKRCFFLFTMGLSMGTMMCIICAMEPKTLGTGIIPMMILLGLSHSLMSTCLWPVFGKIVKRTGIASAYGVAASLNAVACSITPEIRNALVDNPTVFGIFCCIFIGLGMLIVLYLFIRHSKEIGNHAPKRVWPKETPIKKASSLDMITVNDSAKPNPPSAHEAREATNQPPDV